MDEWWTQPVTFGCRGDHGASYKLAKWSQADDFNVTLPKRASEIEPHHSGSRGPIGVRFPALDGVRGLAMLMVFAGHVAIYAPKPAGVAGPVAQFVGDNRGVGVDLFFVLSGFLITGILCDTRDSPGYFLRFYSRRSLRIFPLYYAVFASIMAARVLMPHVDSLSSISQVAMAANLTYSSNFLIAYRGWNVEPLFLLPFWSLAVEEQFYLLWPLVVRALSARNALFASLAGIAGAICVRLGLLFHGNFVGPYVLLPARMDALLVGSMISILFRRSVGLPGWMRSGYFLGLCWGALAFDLVTGGSSPHGGMKELRYALHFTLCALAFGALVVAAIEPGQQRWVPRTLGAPTLRFFGKYSYAIYVFHVAVITALTKIIKRLSITLVGHSVIPPILVTGAIALGICVVLALLSWRILEHPCLRLRERLAITNSHYEHVAR